MRTALFALLTGVPLVLQAQANAEFADLNDTFEMIRSVVALERKAVVADALELTGEESAPFWAIYNNYSADIQAVRGRTVKLITDYAAGYRSMTDELARDMVDEYLDIEGEIVKVRTRYVRRFDDVLPPIKLARFYQIENKLDVIAKLALVEEIPLIY